jgi:hypothetical protein
MGQLHLLVSFDPTIIPRPEPNPVREVLSPVMGDLEVVSSLEDCSGTKWCFNQHKGSGHGPGQGICRADDTYAWDINLNSPDFDSDKGKPVFAVAEGTVSPTYGGCTNAGGSYGQVLIEHTYQGRSWWSGYLHLTSIQVTPGQAVDASTLIGYISNTSPDPIPNHLHFVVYTGENAPAKLASFDTTIVARPESNPPSMEVSVTPYGSFLSNYVTGLWSVPPGQTITAKIADSASLPIEVNVTSGGVPVPGAQVEISEGSFPLGVTDEHGAVKGVYPIPSPPEEVAPISVGGAMATRV